MEKESSLIVTEVVTGLAAQTYYISIGLVANPWGFLLLKLNPTCSNGNTTESGPGKKKVQKAAGADLQRGTSPELHPEFLQASIFPKGGHGNDADG